MKIRDAQMVIVTLILSRGQIVPSMIKNKEEETQDSLEARRMRRVPGEKMIERMENCTVANFFEELGWAGFKVVSVTRQLMADSRQRVKIEFGRFDAVENSDRRLPTSQWGLNAWLVGCVQGALWAVEGWDNPLFVNGEVDPKERTASIVLDGRKPLNQPNGDPVTKWKLDESGKRIGNKPVPIWPEHQLTIVDDTIQLMPV